MPAQQAFLFASILYPSQIQVLYSLLLYDTIDVIVLLLCLCSMYYRWSQFFKPMLHSVRHGSIEAATLYSAHHLIQTFGTMRFCSIYERF